MNDRLQLEIVKTRCAVCRADAHCLIPPKTRTIDNALPTLRCGRIIAERLGKKHCCAGTLIITSARGVAFRTVTVGEGARYGVDEPGPLELLGARPGRVFTRGNG